MKSLMYTKPGLRLFDVPEPQIALEDEVKIRVAYCGICGSDAHVYAGHLDDIFKNPKKPIPFPLGHEASGVVTELGKRAHGKGLKIGDRVTYYFDYLCGSCYYCRNGQEHFCANVEPRKSAMSEYIVVHEQQVYRLPGSVDLLRGALAEPLSVCIHAMDTTEIKVGNRIAISGGGALGLLLVQLAKRCGGTKITVIEPVEKKRTQALALGAQYVINPLGQDIKSEAEKITDGLGFDVVIEASGAKSAARPVCDILAKCGTALYLALYGTDYDHEFNLWNGYVDESRIQFSYQSPYVWPRTMEMLEELNLEPMLQSVYPLDSFQKAFDDQASGAHQKVILKIGCDMETGAL